MTLSAVGGVTPSSEVADVISYEGAQGGCALRREPFGPGLTPEARDAPADDARLLSFSTLKVALPNLLTPILFGYHIGFVGPYATMYRFATNCQLYSSPGSCESLSGAKCQWMDAATVKASSTLGRVCGWEAPRTTCFVMYDDAVTCGGDSDCVWSYSARTCGNKVGYTSIESGLFAGSLIMGALVGSMSGGYLTKWLDYRKSFLLIGVISVTGAVLTHVATGVFQYWLLFVARIVAGFAVGWMPITAPHYTDRFSPKSLQKTLGTFFQVFVAFGTFVAAIFGICLGNTIAYDADHSANVMGRMQGFVSFTTLMSVLVMLLPLVTKDGHCLTSGYGWVDSEEGIPAATKAKAKKYPLSSMIKPALVGATMGCTMQLTGISANMNFAPTIMENLGLDALVGNVIVMAWYSAAAFFAIPLSKRFSMRTLFLSCTLVGSLCCVFLSGIPVYPGVTKVKLAKEVIAIIGIAMFIAAFDMGIASCFYVLSVDVFPESFRPIGSSITTGVMFAMNLVISICYPIATEGMSGGPSGDQDKGQAIAFIFFGCVGLVTFVIEYFYLFPWEDKDDFALGQLEDTQAEMQ